MTETKDELRKRLGEEAYRVTQEKGTEEPFSGQYDQFNEVGVYKCMVCGEKLFSSEKKFDAGCGWPSFSAPAEAGKVVEKEDTSYGMHRKEVICKNCGAHLGHVFSDGPKPSGLRYCINSVSLKHQPNA